MPELPEVEVVRRGLSDHVKGARFNNVEVFNPRAIRNYEGSDAEVAAFLAGHEIHSVERRGKFMWFVLDDGAALVVHLGMSGQMLIKNTDEIQSRYELPLQPNHAGLDDKNLRHLRIRATLSDGQEIWFVDQRTFGYWQPSDIVETANGDVPLSLVHIAPDLLDRTVDISALARRMKRRKTDIKKLLLDQEVVSGIGNIYADEMLWRTQIHPRQKANRMAVPVIQSLLLNGIEVMTAALAKGGTSFDELYVNVNGQSGYFDIELDAYGQQGQPCARCGTLIVKEQFGNRSSHLCPACQRLH